MNDANSLSDLIILAGRLMMAVRERALKSHNVTLSEYKIMLGLEGKDGFAATALAKKVELDNGTLSRLVNRLENAGIVERRSDHVDRRRIFLYLTHKGSSLLPAMKGAIKRIDSKINCTEVDIEVEYIAGFLRRVAKNASNLTNEP